MTEPTDPLPSTNTGLAISPEAAVSLNETGTWGKFLAIVGFCLIGLFIIGAGYSLAFYEMNGMTSNLPGFAIAAIYVVLGVFYIFPTIFLYRFSVMVKTALVSNNSTVLTAALSNLKSLYKFIGILVIVMLCLYVLIGGGALLALKAFR